jgi:hypothetical protein
LQGKFAIIDRRQGAISRPPLRGQIVLKSNVEYRTAGLKTRYGFQMLQNLRPFKQERQTIEVRGAAGE